MAASSAQKAPATKQPDFPLKDFLGVNTQATRTAIAENQFSWLENVYPVGYANLRVLPFQGAAVATIAGGAANYWKYVNINNTDFLIVTTTTGAVFAVNLASYAVTAVKVAGTLTGTVSIAQWKNDRVLFIASNGYFDWDGTTWTSNGGVTSAPSAGSTIATFAGRVWVGNKRTVVLSAPNSYTDFQTVSSGGSFIMTDETLHSNINSLLTANNFLYIWGDSSINVVSDVRVIGTPALTVFSNTNVSALIGTNLPLSIFPFYRTIAFATRYGFYGLFGSTPQKMSDDLDGIIPLIDFTQPVSGDVANLFNTLCICFAFTYLDPVLGSRELLAVLVNKKWFFASQGNGLTLVTGGFQGGVPGIFGIDGTNVYKLFSDTTSAIASTVQTALWPMKKPTVTKNVLKTGIEVTSTATPVTLTATIDTENAALSISFSGINTPLWTNNAGAVVTWQNNALATVGWISSGFQFFAGDVEQYGRYYGFTITSNSPAFTFNGIMSQYENGPNWGDNVGI